MQHTKLKLLKTMNYLKYGYYTVVKNIKKQRIYILASSIVWFSE